MWNCCAIAFACYRTRKCGPSRRSRRRRRRRESCKNCRIRMTIESYRSRGTSSSDSKGSKWKERPWPRENRRKSNRYSSETKISETKSLQQLKKSDDRRIIWNIICTECVKRTTIMLSSASSRSVRLSLRVCKSKTISSSRSEQMQELKLT
jgi:hypothetical protein